VEEMVLTNYHTPTCQQQFFLPSLFLPIYSQRRVATLSNNSKHAIFHNQFSELADFFNSTCARHLAPV